uniref:Putative DNA-binding response regulator in two-component regulatory system with NarX (Or NarQ)[narL] n=1 Tax=Magnetococcus massalia (strain MO-1) TaxID=451514 RepID=A0A1S7LC12_MAGMO|nr:putative DNA-binding response regulator in two-component regulatory system with NarX (or NarQ)[narL] [Candidatus Magnetococcus massalia]
MSIIPERILIADDHEIVCDGIELLLQSQWPQLVVSKALDGMAAVEVAKETRPQLVILDLAMPKMAGADVAREIRIHCPMAYILVFTAFSNETQIIDALEAKVHGIVLKDGGNQQLLVAIKQLLKGENYYAEKLQPIIDSRSNPSEQEHQRRVSLTPRERQILKLVTEGYSSKEIARLLDLSPRTVDNHRRHLMIKLNAKNALELSAYAHKTGLFDSGSEN